MGVELYITRAKFWAENDADSITDREWAEIVRCDPELQPWPENGEHFVRWLGKSAYDEPWLDWSQGNISTKWPDGALFRKMLEIAKKLNAHVQDDDGNVYTSASDWDFDPTQDKQLRTSDPRPWWKVWTAVLSAIATSLGLFIASGAPAAGASLPKFEMVPQIGHSLEVQEIFCTRSKPLIVTGAKDGKIKLWSTDYRLIRTVDVGHFRGVALHPDDSMVAVCKLGGQTEFWSLDGNRIRRLPRIKKPILEQIAFSPTGDYLVVCSASTKNDHCQIFGLDGSVRGRIDHPLNGKPKNNVSGIGFAPDGKKIYLAIGQQVHVFAPNGAVLGQFRVTEGYNAAFAVSPDGQLMATADSETSRKGSIPHTRLWTSNGEMVAEYAGHASRSLAFSNDSQWLVSGGWVNNRVLVIDRAGKQISTFQVGGDAFKSPASAVYRQDRVNV